MMVSLGATAFNLIVPSADRKGDARHAKRRETVDELPSSVAPPVLRPAVATAAPSAVSVTFESGTTDPDTEDHRLVAALLKKPDDVATLMALVALYRGDERAIPHLERVVDLAPNNIIAITDLLGLYRQLGREHEALNLEERFQDVLQNDAALEKRKAHDVYQTEGFEAAQRYLKKELLTVQNNRVRQRVIVEELAFLAKSNGLLDLSLKYLKEAESTCLEDDDCTYLHISAAWTLWEQGHRDDALAKILSVDTNVQSSRLVEDTLHYMTNH
jgi:tetratricopeptide (TPR) repeat protein